MLQTFASWSEDWYRIQLFKVQVYSFIVSLTAGTRNDVHINIKERFAARPFSKENKSTNRWVNRDVKEAFFFFISAEIDSETEMRDDRLKKTTIDKLTCTKKRKKKKKNWNQNLPFRIVVDFFCSAFGPDDELTVGGRASNEVAVVDILRYAGIAGHQRNALTAHQTQSWIKQHDSINPIKFLLKR